MKAVIRKTLSAATLVAAVLVFAVICRMTASDRALKTCDGINLIYADDLRFVSEDDVKGYLDQGYGAYIGQRLDSIKLHKVEKLLNAQSAISKCEAYTTDDGKLNIRLTQREPIVRFQNEDHGFYADANGFIFPLQENYTSLVPVIDGNLPIHSREGYKGAPETEEERTWMAGVVGLLNYMSKNKLWSDNIVQMHVDEKGDLVLIPREGKEQFIFGSPFEAEAKFGRIEKYYRYILPNMEEGYYKTVNVKFDKQIVCKK